MKKRITSVLLTLAMLLSLVPAMGTTAAAAGESHPTAVGELTKGKEACYYRIYPDGTGKTVTWLGYEQAPSDNVATNWDFFKNKIGKEYDKGRTIDGVAYYDQNSGTLYVKGCFVGTCTQVTPSTSWGDVLTVVVDGDTIGNSGWYIDEARKCLKKLNIEFRNNSTLTFTKLDKNNKTATILGVTGHEITGDPRYGNRPVYNTGDLALTGSGTLKIDIPNHAGALYCIRAKNISVEDNVSLDIKTVGNTYTVGHLNETIVKSAAIHCYEKLNIDTTGTVSIVAEKAKLGPNEEDRGSFNAFSFINDTIDGRFNLANAQSVTLKVVDKDDTFINDNGAYQSGWYDTVKSTAEDNGWTVTETEDTSSPFIVKMTRDTMPAAELTVGDNPSVKNIGSAIPSVTVNGGETVAVKASVELPAWLSKMYTDGRVKLGDSRTMNIYKGNSLSSDDLVTSSDMTGYAVAVNVTSLPTISFETSNFKPVAGQTYTVYASFPIVTVNGSKQLGSASVIATIKAVEQQNTEISSVTLTSPGMQEGATSGGDFTCTNTGVATTNTAWLNDLTGGAKLNTLYTAKVTLTAENGYVFTKDTAVNVTNSSGYYEVGTPSISADGKTMTVRVLVAATHDHQWEWRDNSDDTHSQVCTLTGCNAKRNTENHTYTTTETTTQITYTCTKCGKTRNETKTGENVIWAISAPVTAPKASESAAGTWVTLENQYAEDAEITSAKWTEGNADAAAAAEEFSGKFNAYSTYTLTVTFTAKGEKAFKNPQLWRPLQCLDGTPSAATVSTDGKTLTQSITFTIKMPVSVKVTLNDLAADGTIVPPTIEDGKATSSLLGVNKGGTFYSYSYANSTWSSSAGTTTAPTLNAGESATLGLALVGENDEECIAVLQSTDNVNGLVAGAYAEKNGVYATYAVADETTAKAITSVDLTVTAPEYGKAPATTATGADNAKYTVGAPTWSPTVTDNKFGADTYTVSIPVTAETGYSFAEGCVYTINGYTATYDTTNKKVSYTFPALIAPHTHTYGNWAKLDDSYHSRTCTAGDDIQVEAHTWGNWKALSGIDEHERTCTACGAKQTEKHNWTVESVENATFESEGTINYKCSGCGAGKSSSIAKLVKIDVANLTVAKPVKDVAAAEAITTDAAYYVAATEWVAADGTVLDITNGDKFQPGTVYTVKITLETAGDGVFSASSTYNQIAGKTATVSPALTGDGYTDTVVLTYTFDATAEASPTEYTITVTDGKATVGAGTPISKAAEGTTITLTADAAPSGKVFDKWVVESGSITLADASSATTSFTMPASTVSVKATYKDAPVATYALTTKVNGGHGTISESKTGLTAGSTETVIFTPDSGYEIDTVTVNGVAIPVLSNVLDVTMDADKTVIVTYKAIGSSGHSHSYGSEWKNDATNHWHECSCGDKDDVAAHSFKWVVDKEATETQKGSKHEKCTVCGYKKAAVDISAIGSTTKPTDPSQTNPNTGANSPKTGDDSNMILWIVLLVASGLGITGTVVYSKRKKRKIAQ